MCIPNLVCLALNRKMPTALDRKQFSLWLSGFIDAEGNFQVFLDRQYLRVAFRIRLHVDDIAVLYKIRDFLGVGTVTSSKDSCVFTISNVNDLNTVLFPLLDSCFLYTTKWLDYRDFKLAVNYLSTASTTRLSSERLLWVNSIMQGMNSTRTQYDYSLIPKLDVINKYWLLGFVEGEGTFGFKNLVPYFQIGQNTRSLMVIKAIAAFLESLPKTFTFTQNSQPPVVTNTLNIKTSVAVISIANVDALYDYLLFFFLDMSFQTRKSTDFFLWCLGLYFHKFGHYYLPEGRALVIKISQYINTGRYSNNPDRVSPPDLNCVKNVLGLTLPVTLTPEMTHLHLSQAFSSLVKVRNVWVYDNGILVNSQPFTSYAAAQEAIGIPRTSVVVRRNIDTGKFYLNRYTFYSYPPFNKG